MAPLPMLEHASLWPQPWSLPAVASAPGRPRPGAVRGVLDADTEGYLGFACRQAGAAPSWLYWILPPTLAVHEAEDNSLLFTVHPVWVGGARWLVRDADGGPVGALRQYVLDLSLGRARGRGTLLEDPYGRPFALLEHSRGEAAGQFRALDGSELGTLSRGEDGTRLAFREAPPGNPFVRMLLLAAALVNDER
jgi:hypothetical protein